MSSDKEFYSLEDRCHRLSCEMAFALQRIVTLEAALLAHHADMASHPFSGANPAMAALQRAVAQRQSADKP